MDVLASFATTGLLFLKNTKILNGIKIAAKITRIPKMLAITIIFFQRLLIVYAYEESVLFIGISIDFTWFFSKSIFRQDVKICDIFLIIEINCLLIFFYYNFYKKKMFKYR